MKKPRQLDIKKLLHKDKANIDDRKLSTVEIKD